MIEPSLQLNFAKTRQLDRRISFSRADTADNQASYYDANGILRFVRKGEPRFTHDPSTGDSLGLLVEEARTNLFTYSEDFRNTADAGETRPWAYSRLTVTPNATTAPDDTTTADALYETAVVGGSYVYRSLTLNAATQYALSVYVKAIPGATQSRLTLQLSSTYGFDAVSGGNYPYLTFNIQTGTVISGANYIVEPCPDGWYRLSVYGNNSTGYTGNFIPFTVGLTDVATSGIYAWGIQLEVGSFPTSYIPCVASTVTRVADSATMTGANFSSWYRQDEGTFVVAFQVDAYSRSTSYGVIHVGDGTTLNAIRMWHWAGNPGALYNTVTASGANQYGPAIGALSATQQSAALAYKTNDFNGALNGSVGTTDVSGSVPLLDRFVIGSAVSALHTALSGAVARITYYPKRLTNAELKALSTL